MPSSVQLYLKIYEGFQAAVSAYDCGRKCAPHNGGQPVCCTTRAAVPIVDKAEWELLRSRTDLWRRYKPADKAGREIVESLPKSCVAVECKGAAHCERDNRSFSCRTFPFFPYIEADGSFRAIAYYWTFEDRCWVLSNLQIVDQAFIDQFCAAYEALFAAEPDEFAAHKEKSASMRRVFTRWNRIIPLIGRTGEPLAVEPRTHVIRPADFAQFPRHAPYDTEPAAAPARSALAAE